ncbi:hypothetical protein SUDANB95_01974 [Actinosynnema sp. ALI-1.44]
MKSTNSIIPERSNGRVLDREQRYVRMLYAHLDRLRARTAEELAGVLAGGVGGTHQARSERDAAAGVLERRRAQLAVVEKNLCFGALHRADGRVYVGRIGLFAEDDDYEPLLLDWRAPAARPFYTATAVHNEGVVLRRHIRTEGRSVVGVDDDLLDRSGLDDGEVVGEAALMVALEARRTDRMSDIVATIQRDQDRIIRAPLGGVLVVEGGPGTGKTAVALHRVAFLLYSHRERLEKAGVLVIGPHARFLHHIDQVLPSLGETGVLSRTVGQLFPGLDAVGRDPWRAAWIKGQPTMVDAMAAAVRDRERVPEVGCEVEVDGYPLLLDRLNLELIREVARGTQLPHNRARPLFERLVVAVLADRMMRRLGREFLDEEDFLELQAELREEPAVRAALAELWPVLTPQRLLIDLFTSPERLAAALPDLAPEDRALLLRDPPADDDARWFSPEDVPLLDEAAELLGDPTAAPADDDEALSYARGVLSIIDTDEMTSGPDVLRAIDVIDARRLAERHRVRPDLTAADRAEADRTWTFGHVVVDEAQELSPMAWRMVMRRCPTRSMTIVGDLQQGSSPARATSWQEVLERYAGDRWRRERLEVNYRTPAEVMDLVHDLLPEFAHTRSVRSSGQRPWRERIPLERLVDALPGLVARELGAMDGGTLAVFVPEALHATLARPEAPGVTVHTAAVAKGLEFDSVIVVGPDLIRDETPLGRTDLYVVLTRATRRLGLVDVDDAGGAT